MVDGSIDDPSNNAHGDANSNLSSRQRAEHANGPPPCGRKIAYAHFSSMFLMHVSSVAKVLVD